MEHVCNETSLSRKGVVAAAEVAVGAVVVAVARRAAHLAADRFLDGVVVVVVDVDVRLHAEGAVAHPVVVVRTTGCVVIRRRNHRTRACSVHRTGTGTRSSRQ